MAAIGIDLGTTNSCVAVFLDKQAEVIANDHGNRVTPSYVAFTDKEKYVGEAAKEQESSNFRNTVYQIKRMIGRKFSDDVVQNDMKLWRFRVVNGNGYPNVEVEYKMRKQVFRPETISADILRHMKETADTYLGREVPNVVITVPSYFNNAQRLATRNAGTIAGLDVLAMINEPTAAVVAYDLQRGNKEKRTVLVFDLGGGTFDVTIFDIENGKIDTRATGGDTHLGGEDFTNKLLDHFSSEFNLQNFCDMKNDDEAMCRLREKCEQAKITLSNSKVTSAKINVPALFNGKKFSSSISRAKFEDMNRDDFQKTIDITKDVMKVAGVRRDEIDDIVMVGGSSRILKIKSLLGDLFPKKLKCDINPEEAVAYGAAVKAAKLSNDLSPQINNIRINEVTALSLGIEVKHDVMTVVVPSNTKIPTKRCGKYLTSEDNQPSARFSVYEGERACAKDNHFLGEFTINDLLLLPKGEVKFDVWFDIDESGIIEVTAYDKSTGNENGIKIQNTGGLTKKEMTEMIEDAKKNRIEDKKFRDRQELLHNIETSLYDYKKKIKQKYVVGMRSRKLKNDALDEFAKIEMWLETNGERASIETLRRKQSDVERIYYSVSEDRDWL